MKYIIVFGLVAVLLSSGCIIEKEESPICPECPQSSSFNQEEFCLNKTEPVGLSEPTELNIRFEYDEADLTLNGSETIRNNEIVVFDGEWYYLIRVDIHKEFCDLVCINYPFDKMDVELIDQDGVQFPREHVPLKLRTTSSYDCYRTDEGIYPLEYRQIVLEQIDTMDEIGNVKIVCQKSEWMERQRLFNECMEDMEESLDGKD
jgi:hypothetical protein